MAEGRIYFFKFTFMKTKRKAVSTTHANAQVAAKPASSRLARRDTDDSSQSGNIDSQMQGEREGKASHRNAQLYIIQLLENLEFEHTEAPGGTGQPKPENEKANPEPSCSSASSW